MSNEKTRLIFVSPGCLITSRGAQSRHIFSGEEVRRDEIEADSLTRLIEAGAIVEFGADDPLPSFKAPSGNLQREWNDRNHAAIAEVADATRDNLTKRD